MKTKLRKLLSLLLCLALCLCALPAAYAENDAAGLTGAVIPKDATRIDDEAFFGCATLASVTIPAGVLNIGAGAFSGCTALADVYYGGTRAQWSAVTIGSDNEPLYSATLHCADDKAVINVMSFTDEVPRMIDRYLETHPDFAARYDVNYTINTATDGTYQPALDQALTAGGAGAPDLYCTEASYTLRYTQGDMAAFAAAYEDLGIDVAAEIEASQIAPYSVEIGTRPYDGKVVGLGYQATGGAFIYRRSIAKDVFGSDDPAVVTRAIGGGTQSWGKFFEAAAALKAKGYAIVSGDGDIWHPIENSSDRGWIIDGRLNIDPKREAFLDYAKLLKDNDLYNDTEDWTEEWYDDMAGLGRRPVFGFYGPAWLINYVMAEKAGDTYGDWAVCPSNVGFFWGGTWLLANKNTAKAEAVAELIRWITLDSSENGLQYGWANGTWSGRQTTKDTVASGAVMAKSNGQLAFLGGQNMFEAFVPANEYANGSNLTQYDETINNCWRDAVRLYTAGEVSRDEAIFLFKMYVSESLGIEVDS